MRLIDADIAAAFAKNCEAFPEVVTRCKDCKYSCKDGNGRTCEGYWYELSDYAVSVKDDAFCSYGKPKEGDHA